MGYNVAEEKMLRHRKRSTSMVTRGVVMETGKDEKNLKKMVLDEY